MRPSRPSKTPLRLAHDGHLASLVAFLAERGFDDLTQTATSYRPHYTLLFPRENCQRVRFALRMSNHVTRPVETNLRIYPGSDPAEAARLEKLVEAWTKRANSE